MKKILTFLLTIFLFSTNVSAASICSYEEQATLNQKAANIKVKYDVVTEVVNYEDMDSTMEVFDISIMNITEEFYAVVKNDVNNEEKIFYYSDTTDGIAKFRWIYAESVTNFTVLIYTTEKTSCPDEKYKTFYLTTPRFNSFYNTEICQDLYDFYLCQKFVNFSEVSEDKFLDQLESYQNGLVDNKGDVIEEENPKITDKIFNFFDDYKWYIVGGCVVVVSSIIVIYRIKTKKQRELGL